MRYTFKKAEKLKKRKLIGQLFQSGKGLSVYPLKLVYLEISHESPYKIQAGVSVSKRNFKKAVDRNRIKRILREIYRRNKHLVYASEHTKKHIFMFIYVGKKEEDCHILEEKMKQLLRKFLERNKTEKNEEI